MDVLLDEVGVCRWPWKDVTVYCELEVLVEVTQRIAIDDGSNLSRVMIDMIHPVLSVEDAYQDGFVLLVDVLHSGILTTLCHHYNTSGVANWTFFPIGQPE